MDTGNLKLVTGNQQQATGNLFFKSGKINKLLVQNHALPYEVIR